MPLIEPSQTVEQLATLSVKYFELDDYISSLYTRHQATPKLIDRLFLATLIKDAESMQWEIWESCGFPEF